jgi:hypothetical protein
VPISSTTEFQEPERYGIPTSYFPPTIPATEDDRPIIKDNLERFPQIPEHQQDFNENDAPQPPVLFQEVFDEFVPDDDFTTAQMTKRGKGRPRKITTLAEQVQIFSP